LADEEAFFVVVRVDKPARDSFGSIAANFARIRMEYVHTVDFHLNLVILRFDDVDVRLAKDHEEIALARVLQIIGHVQIGIHVRLQHWDAAELIEFGGVRVVIEGTSDEYVEASISGFAGCGDKIGAGHSFQTRDR